MSEEMHFEGCVIVRAADGEALKPLNSKDFQQIVLTCLPTDVTLVETTSFGLVISDSFGEET